MKYFWCIGCVLLGCSGAAPPVEAKVSVVAQSSDGSPLPGVVLETSGRRATSGADGTITLVLSGSEGERREVGVVCPEHYQASSPSLMVSIRRAADAASAYHYDVTCAPLRHSVVVVTRAINGPNLRILHLGAEIGRTNAEGVAHAIVSVPAGDSLRLTLDTRDQDLLPRSPSFDFPAVDHDELLTITQVFEVKARPKPQLSRRAPKKAAARPTRL